MTRFSISLDEGVNLVLSTLKGSWGGEIMVPKIPSYRITDIAKAIAPECKIEEIGIRPGEKLHEEMITESDSFNTIECENHYIIIPPVPQWDCDQFIKTFNGTRVPFGFTYNSGTNKKFLSVEELKVQISNHLNYHPETFNFTNLPSRPTTVDRNINSSDEGRRI